MCNLARWFRHIRNVWTGLSYMRCGLPSCNPGSASGTPCWNHVGVGRWIWRRAESRGKGERGNRAAQSGTKRGGASRYAIFAEFQASFKLFHTAPTEPHINVDQGIAYLVPSSHRWHTGVVALRECTLYHPSAVVRCFQWHDVGENDCAQRERDVHSLFVPLGFT